MLYVLLPIDGHLAHLEMHHQRSYEYPAFTAACFHPDDVLFRIVLEYFNIGLNHTLHLRQQLGRRVHMQNWPVWSASVNVEFDKEDPELILKCNIYGNYCYCVFLLSFYLTFSV